ncbi:MAG: RdgB/HAM1 family non-canonical purine NTP pyrophosphatase [Myxococcaceae bacterium]|nr:RdgB/HAM1 family non-canonical purine NTP pyrophosphatase [Myxococcaceae bacterium]
MKLIFATTNAGKLAELKSMLGDTLEVSSAGDFPQVAEVIEDQPTFELNAAKKALVYARATGLCALADDSGLCVDLLAGRPGVQSARYAPTDKKRIHRLLNELDGVPLEKRTARFQCALCLAWPDGKLVTVMGTCSGRITEAPRGEGGFGYDPIFEPLGQTRTMAEMTKGEKSSVSHRGQAFAQMKPHLKALAEGGQAAS